MLRFEKRPTTANRAARGTTPGARRAHAAVTHEWRRAFSLLAKKAGVPALGPCDIIVRTVLPDRRGRHDTAACYPSYKAAQDGLVDAGVWPDDEPRWVRTVVFEAPMICKGRTGLELELRPAADPPGA